MSPSPHRHLAGARWPLVGLVLLVSCAHTRPTPPTLDGAAALNARLLLGR